MSAAQAKSANPAEIFSDSLRALREECQLSQEEMAAELGITRNYVSMLELGRKHPSAQLRKAFSAFAESQRRRKKLMSEIVERDETQQRQITREDEPPDDMSYLPRRSLFPSSRPPALQGITAKLNDEELLDSIDQSVLQLRQERNPLFRVGYLTAIRIALDEMEQRMSK